MMLPATIPIPISTNQNIASVPTGPKALLPLELALPEPDVLGASLPPEEVVVVAVPVLAFVDVASSLTCPASSTVVILVV